MLFRCVPCKLKIVINLLSATQNSKYKYIYKHIYSGAIFFSLTHRSMELLSILLSQVQLVLLLTYSSSLKNLIWKSLKPSIWPKEGAQWQGGSQENTSAVGEVLGLQTKKNICSNHAKTTVSSNTSIYMCYMHYNKTWEAECRVLKE